MPEFILEHGTPSAAAKFNALDDFTRGYIEAMFFTNASSPDDGDLSTATVADLAAETWNRIEKDCAAFQEANASLLAQAYGRDDYSPEQAGRDYWFTRNGHGVGYWDREQLEPDSEAYEVLTAQMIANRDNPDVWDAALAKRNALKAESIGERLSVAARHREVDVYAGGDGRVYLS